jgi:hypothetical protein
LKKSDVVEYFLALDKHPIRHNDSLTPDIVERFGLDPYHKIVVRGSVGDKIEGNGRETMNLPPIPRARRIHTLDQRIKALSPLFLLTHTYLGKDAVFTPLNLYYNHGLFPKSALQCFPRLALILYPENGQAYYSGMTLDKAQQLATQNNTKTTPLTPQTPDEINNYISHWLKRSQSWDILVPDVQPLTMPPEFTHDDVVIGIFHGDQKKLWKPSISQSTDGITPSLLLTIPINTPLLNSSHQTKKDDRSFMRNNLISAPPMKPSSMTNVSTLSAAFSPPPIISIHLPLLLVLVYVNTHHFQLNLRQ